MEAHNDAPLFIGDRELRLDYAQGAPERTPSLPNNKLFFKGFEGTQEELREALGELGQGCNDVFLRAFPPLSHHTLWPDQFICIQ